MANEDGGIVRSSGVSVGKLDETKAKLARKQGKSRTAGMLLDTAQVATTGSSTYRHDTYRTSYAYGLSDTVGGYDVPIYFADMNQRNGGILYWPTSLHEKYSWYRYLARSNPYVARALELLVNLPLSKISLNMPAMPKGQEELGEEILEFFNEQLRRLNMFELFQSILYEEAVIGNVFIFCEYDEKAKMWSRAVILPPEEVYCFVDPFTNDERIEYKPQRLISLIQTYVNGGAVENAYDGSNGLNEEIVKAVPQELIDMVQREGKILMDNDPATGSFVHHIARWRAPYEDLGVSLLERILVPLMIKEFYKFTQLSLSSRNMTPKNLITANGIQPAELDELRTQVDLSYLDPEYSIVTNYEVNWQQIGAQDRLLDLTSEHEQLDNQIFAGLGVTREILTGEAQYSGTKINLEILNTMFMQKRETLKNFVITKLFEPLCERHGWYKIGRHGIKHYFTPTIGFNRLSIRDNNEVFDSLFQLYSKGSLPVSVIYELFNLDAKEMDDQLRADAFTARDATFNRAVEEANSWVGQHIGENSDLLLRVANYLKLRVKKPKQSKEDEADDSGVSMDAHDYTEPVVEIPQLPETINGVESGKLAQMIAETLGKDATPADVDEAIALVEKQLEGAKKPFSVEEAAKAIVEILGKNATTADVDEAIQVVSDAN